MGWGLVVPGRTVIVVETTWPCSLSVVEVILGIAGVKLEFHVGGGFTFPIPRNVGNADDLQRSHGDDEG